MSLLIFDFGGLVAWRASDRQATSGASRSCDLEILSSAFTSDHLSSLDTHGKAALFKTVFPQLRNGRSPTRRLNRQKWRAPLSVIFGILLCHCPKQVQLHSRASRACQGAWTQRCLRPWLWPTRQLWSSQLCNALGSELLAE